MGLTRVALKVKNPANPKKQYQGEFLVDSGATHTVVPATVLKKPGSGSECCQIRVPFLFLLRKGCLFSFNQLFLRRERLPSRLRLLSLAHLRGP